MKFKKITKNNIFEIYKSILSTLGLVHLLDNRNKEERERLRYEMERAEKIRDKNNKRLSGRRK
tara:strand:- start:399 stop:587 length:189 start_codon:yes stop_codon:yes gene_type:complete